MQNTSKLLRPALALAVAAFTLSATTPLSHARRGADDPAGHDAGDEKGVRRAPGATDDPDDHDINDDKGGLRAPGTSDDPADHDINDDKGGKGRGGKDDAPGHT